MVKHLHQNIYDSQQLKIWVPNVIMVFSNSPACFSNLELLWVFCINNDQLQNENKSPKEKKENVYPGGF